MEYKDFHKLYEENRIEEANTFRLFQLLRDARNTICYDCGKYENEHNGACDGCCWRM